MASWYIRLAQARQKLGPLGQQLSALRPQMASAAQNIYNQWEQVDGMDEEFGGGGICDEVANAISNVILGIEGVETTEGGQDGDDHAYVIAYNQTEAYSVDIPPGVYETGGGYNWTKIPDVVIDASNVSIYPMNRADFQF